MIIVVVHWKIRPDKENQEAFKQHWAKHLDPGDRQQIVGEFLGFPVGSIKAGFPCGKLGFHDPRYVSYFNIGIWESLDAFNQQIIQPFVGKNPQPFPFEYELRERMILEPQQWRRGLAELVPGDNLS